MRAAPVIAILLMGAAAACGGSDGRSEPAAPSTSTSASPTTSAGADPAADRCEAFRTIADRDDRFQAELNAVLEPVMTAAQRGDTTAAEAAADEMTRTIKTLLDTELGPLVAAYDRLAKAAPELEPDVRTVRDFTVRLAQSLSEVDGAEEFQSVVRAAGEQGGLKAGAATLRLDKVSRTECNVVIAD